MPQKTSIIQGGGGTNLAFSKKMMFLVTLSCLMSILVLQVLVCKYKCVYCIYFTLLQSKIILNKNTIKAIIPI